MMSLAKAYYLDGQTEKAKTTLTTAGTLLRGTSLEKVIHLTLSDLRILGNDIAVEDVYKRQYKDGEIVEPTDLTKLILG